MTGSRWFMFCAGAAAGAVGYKYYPRLKEAIGPLAAAAMAGMETAAHDAREDAAARAEQPGETAHAPEPAVHAPHVRPSAATTHA
jgi:hypothetical protein